MLLLVVAVVTNISHGIATCISLEISHQVAPLVLVTNVTTSWYLFGVFISQSHNTKLMLNSQTDPRHADPYIGAQV